MVAQGVTIVAQDVSLVQARLRNPQVPQPPGGVGTAHVSFEPGDGSSAHRPPFPTIANGGQLWATRQICLSQIDGRNGSAMEWLSDFDSWGTRNSYRAGFAILEAGFAEFGLGVLATKFSWLSHHDAVGFALPIFVAAGYAVPMYYVMNKYNREDGPWVAFFADLGINLVK